MANIKTQPKGLPDSIITRYDIKPSRSKIDYMRILLSGISGSGKTSVIGTASRNILSDPDINNVIYFEFDPQGSDTLIGMNVEVDTVHPNCYTGTTNAQRGIIELLTALRDNPGDYDVCAIDPYNRMQLIIEQEIIKEEASKSRNIPHSPERMELQDYGTLLTRCERINDLLLQLPMHVIVTCISDGKIDPLDLRKVKREDKDLILSLSLDGRMAHLLSSQFSLHGVMRKVGNATNIKTQTDFEYMNTEAKSRLRLKTSSIENVSFPDLLSEVGIKDSKWDDVKWQRDHRGFTAEWA